LGRFWGGFGEVLGRFWGGFGEVLGRFWGGFGEVLGAWIVAGIGLTGDGRPYTDREELDEFLAWDAEDEQPPLFG
jgi:hypothetical protein